MGSHIIDSKLFRDFFGTSELRHIFSDEYLIQRWLDVEAALARAEARLNIIPKEAANEITRKANIENINIEEMEMEIKRTDHPIVPLIRQLEKECDNDFGQYVHWGATTQDIMDTAVTLQIKDSFKIINQYIIELRRILLNLTETHLYTLMPGRTHGQHALPITFGYKVSVWLEEINRHYERLDSIKDKLFVGQFSGAAGTLASLKKDGFKVQELLMEELELDVPSITWHTSRDNWIEYASLLAMIAGSAEKIANEITVLQKTEINELEEPFVKGKVGSSTMPHKRNPMACENILSLARIIRKNASLLLEGMSHEHERDIVPWKVEWEAIPELILITGATLNTLNYVLTGLKVNKKKMRENIDLTNGQILSESIMLALGEKIGRQKSHDYIYEACIVAYEEDLHLSEVILADESVKKYLSEQEILDLFDPENYIGLAVEMARKIIEKTKKDLN